VSLSDELHAEQEITELRRALQQSQRQVAAAKRRTDDLVEAVFRAAKEGNMAAGRGKPMPPRPKDARKRPGEVVLIHTTDWQLGKRTADYNVETCGKRIDQLIAKALDLTEIQRAHHPVRECHLMLGGDMVEGLTIFPGQAFEVEAHLYEQLFEVSRIIERVVRTLAREFDKVHVTCEFGNHGRLGKKGEMPAHDNIDAVSYKIAQDRTDDLKNVTWTLSGNWYQMVTIGNYSALLVHGDEIKSFGGNTPAFGILRKCNAWATGVVPAFHDVYMGHFHTPMSLTMANGGRIFVTGSPESMSVYAAEFIAAKGRPSQRVHFVDPIKARVTAEYVVWLD
jgi:hypothetical protein